MIRNKSPVIFESLKPNNHIRERRKLIWLSKFRKGNVWLPNWTTTLFLRSLKFRIINNFAQKMVGQLGIVKKFRLRLYFYAVMWLLNTLSLFTTIFPWKSQWANVNAYLEHVKNNGIKKNYSEYYIKKNNYFFK